MRHAAAAVIFATALLAGGAASAVEASDLETAKHLTMLELYLRGARDTAKALQVVGTIGTTPSDPSLIDEVAARAVDQVGKSEIHLRHLKKLGANTGRIEFHVKKARTAVNQLSAFRARDGRRDGKHIEDLRVAAEHINAHVSDALRRIDTLAGEIGHATLEDTDLRERVPVRGKDR
jgi:hypothetical protein